MSLSPPYIIKSFKHNGKLHRMWLENWLVPVGLLFPEHRAESMMVLINSQTRIREADGREWVSRIPSVAFFLPGCWYNVIALIEEAGIRYYCNIASPPFIHHAERVITYIDYDLDVIRSANGEVHVVDQKEYELHQVSYHYSDTVKSKVESGLSELTERIRQGQAPFDDGMVQAYYELWKQKGDSQSHD
jgi:uncharacterized protein